MRTTKTIEMKLKDLVDNESIMVKILKALNLPEDSENTFSDKELEKEIAITVEGYFIKGYEATHFEPGRSDEFEIDKVFFKYNGKTIDITEEEIIDEDSL